MLDSLIRDLKEQTRSIVTPLSFGMLCSRCCTQQLPNNENTVELMLRNWNISVTLKVLNCANCRISIYLKTMHGPWMDVENYEGDEEMKRNGWELVETPNDLIKFYLLSQVYFNQIEGGIKEDGHVTFDFPDENDLVKILWYNGVAIGFYTVKRKESITFDTMEIYEMTTLDTAFIKKAYRRHGFGISILQDLVETFPNEDVGISTPISKPMYHVIVKFLAKHPNFRMKLWEVSGVGSKGNRKLLCLTVKKVLWS